MRKTTGNKNRIVYRKNKEKEIEKESKYHHPPYPTLPYPILCYHPLCLTYYYLIYNLSQLVLQLDLQPHNDLFHFPSRPPPHTLQTTSSSSSSSSSSFSSSPSPLQARGKRHVSPIVTFSGTLMSDPLIMMYSQD